ncbi:MAG: hypothetical protein COA44_15790 [Arcobacter sp.]|nr:MAG: hypothetical protein COA44_15790 [Arcobacter sp.]
MEEVELIGKRINLDVKNIKRAKIIAALLEDDLKGLSDKKKLDTVINKAIESYYKSDEVKKLLEL